MTDLVKQVARAIGYKRAVRFAEECGVEPAKIKDWNVTSLDEEDAQAAIATVLGAMKEPSHAVKMATAGAITEGHMKAMENYDAACDCIPVFVQAFASEHNVEIG